MSAAAIVESCRLLPMMSDRRVVVVLRGERLLKPKRRGRGDRGDRRGGRRREPPSDLDALDDYRETPEPSTTLVLVASDIDRSRRVGKTILKHATVVECWGLKPGKDARVVDLRQAARVAEQLVRKAVADAGQQIDPPAARLIAERAGIGHRPSARRPRAADALHDREADDHAGRRAGGRQRGGRAGRLGGDQRDPEPERAGGASPARRSRSRLAPCRT